MANPFGFVADNEEVPAQPANEFGFVPAAPVAPQDDLGFTPDQPARAAAPAIPDSAVEEAYHRVTKDDELLTQVGQDPAKATALYPSMEAKLADIKTLRQYHNQKTLESLQAEQTDRESYPAALSFGVGAAQGASIPEEAGSALTAKLFPKNSSIAMNERAMREARARMFEEASDANPAADAAGQFTGMALQGATIPGLGGPAVSTGSLLKRTIAGGLEGGGVMAGYGGLSGAGQEAARDGSTWGDVAETGAIEAAKNFPIGFALGGLGGLHGGLSARAAERPVLRDPLAETIKRDAPAGEPVNQFGFVPDEKPVAAAAEESAPAPYQQLEQGRARLSSISDALEGKEGAPMPADSSALEKPETIQAQLGWLNEGKRDAILLPKGQPDVQIPDGMAALSTERGTFIYNPEKLSEPQINDAVKNDTVGKILNYGIDRKPEGDSVAVVVRSPEGLEKQTVITDEANYQNVLEQSRKVAGPEDRVSVEAPEKVVSERVEAEKKAFQPTIEDLPLKPDESAIATREPEPGPDGVHSVEANETTRRLALESVRSRATQDLRATLGRIGINVEEDYSPPEPGVEPHAAGAWYGKKGDIGVAIYPDRAIEQALDAGHTAAGQKLIQDQHGEELIHVANLVALRDEWVKGANRTVNFQEYVNDSMSHIIKSIGYLYDELRANGETAKADLLEKRALASGNLYYADLDKSAPQFHSLSDLLQHLEENPDKIPKFAAEMVRQHVEARESSGLTTEVGYKQLIQKLQQWVEESLAVLKKAALGSKFGEMGKPLQIAIAKTEGVLKGIREGTFKSAAEKADRSNGKSFFTRLPESSDQNPLSGLSKEVEEAAKTSESLPSRISTAKRIAARYYDAKDAVGNAVINARSGFSTMVGALKDPPKFTEFKRILGEWLGQLQRNDLELRRFSENIKKTIPDAMRREAITNYLQAGGDLSLLKERASKSKGSLKLGYEMATQLTPREIQVAQQIRAYFDSMLKDGVDNGLLEHGVKNYVSQLWAKDNVATQQLMADIEIGKLNKNFKFAQERFYSSFFDGEQAGFKPKTKDIGAIVAAYDQAFNQSIAARAFIKQLTENGIASDKRPFVVLSGSASPVEEGTSGLFINPKAAPKNYGDYLPLDHPSLRGWKWVETDGATGKNVFLQGEARLHPEIAPHMKAVFERSAFETNTFLRVVGKPLLNIQSFIKSNMLSLSMFHLVQEGEHALGYRVNPFKVDKLDLNNPKQYSLVTHGLQVSSFHAMQEFAEGVAGGSKPLINKLPWIGEKVLQPVQDWLFHEYIPRLKMQTALKMMERNEARFGAKLSHDQLLELSASQANAAYGELNYKYMGRSATTQDVFRLVALAPDFLEARVRTVGQAFTKHGTEQRANMALLTVGTFVVARVMNKLLDDDYHTEDPFRIHAGGKVYGFRIIPEDIYSMLTQTRRFIAGRESPLVSFVHDISTGTDYRGASMSSGQIVKSQLRNMLPSGINRMRDRSIGDTLLTAGGMQVTNSTNAQQIGQQARDFNAKTGFKQDSANVFHESRFKDLKTQLQLGETDAARDEYLRLIKTENVKDFQTALRASFNPRRPFTGSQAQERAFIASLDPRQRERYNDAVKEQVALSHQVETLIKDTSKADIQQAMAERKKARMAQALATK